MDAVQRRGSPERMHYIKRFGLSMLPPPRVSAIALDAGILTSAIMQSCGLHFQSSSADDLAQSVYSLWQKRQGKFGGPSLGDMVAECGDSLKVRVKEDGKAVIDAPITFVYKVGEFVDWIIDEYKVGKTPVDVGGGDMSVSVVGGITYIGGVKVYPTQYNITEPSWVIPSVNGTYMLYSSYPDLSLKLDGNICTFSTQIGTPFSSGPYAQYGLVLAYYFNAVPAYVDLQYMYFSGSKWSFGSSFRNSCPDLTKKLTALYLAGPTGMRLAVTAPGAMAIPKEEDWKEYDTWTIDTGLALGANVTLPQVLDQIGARTTAGDFAPTGTATKATDIPATGEMAGDISLEGIKAQEASLGAVFTRTFPFSIPWDLTRAIALLAAPPVTPHFEVDFLAPIADLVGGWDGETKIVIDFERFEILGQLCRWLTTLLFVASLITGTKRLIWTA